MAWPSPTDARTLANEFVQALPGQSGVRPDRYIAPGAEVYLQGARAPISPTQFGAYLDQMKHDKRAFRAAGSVYMTSTGAGWLVSIDSLERTATTDQPPALWMEVRIQDGRITRLWVHFTVESLERLHITPAAYTDTALAQGIPVPAAWADGTSAMLSAAARIDQQMAVGWMEVARRLWLIPLFGGLGLGVGSLLASKPRRAERPAARTGEMLVKLRNMRSAQLD